MRIDVPGREPPTSRAGRGPLGALPRLSSSARRALAGCAGLAALTALATVAQAWALASVLADVVAGRPGPFGPRLALLAGAVLARAVLGWTTQVVAARAAAGAKEELRAALLDRALARGPEWIAARGPAELTTLATKGLDALDAYFTRYLPAAVTAAVVPPGIGAVILFADWPSAVVIALTLPLIPVFAALVGLHTRDRVRAATETMQRLSGHLLELVRALPVLTAFRRAEAQGEAVRRVSDAHRRTSMATLRLAFASALVLELVATLSVAVVAVLIGFRLLAGDLGLAVGLFVLILAPECYLPLRTAGAAHHASEDGLEAVRRVAEVLESKPLEGEGGRLRPASPVGGGLRVTGLRVRRRSGYAPDGLSFTVRPGEIVRLDEPSGSGKSTTFGVLLGFVQPDAGTIEGLPARAEIAWVPQHPAFTGGTAAAEIALAATEPPTRDELESVAAQAVAEHLLDRPVDRLSTGERQRVAIARALLRVRRGARLLLLDEPTAHLDADTAALIMKTVHAVAAEGVAVVVSSHRNIAVRSNERQFSNRVHTLETEAPAGSARLRALITPRLLAGAALGAAALIAGVALTATSAWLIAKASQQPPVLALSVAVVGVRTFGLARAGLRYVERLVTHDAAFRSAAELRGRLWAALVRVGPAHTIGLRRTEGLQRLVDDVDAVRDLTPRVLLPPLVAVGACVVAVGVLGVVHPLAGLVLAAAVLVAGLAAPALAVMLDRRATAALAGGRRRVAAGVLGLLDAAPDLIAFGAQQRKRAELAALDVELADRARRQAFGVGAAGALVTLVTGVAAVLAAWLTTIAGAPDPVLAPVLALVPLALAEAMTLLPPAAQSRAALHEAYGRVHEVDGWRAEALPEGDECRPGTVAVHDADVRWPGAAAPALSGATLYLPQGARVAVVGPSGSGKSTLMALLLGFLAPERGAASTPGRVAWCPQEPQLVSTTVRENLRIGDPEADDARLVEALRQAGIGHWADRLDLRLNPAAISGGEAQRIALARALLAAPNADLVLLDEPTAHLDVFTAHTVLAGLRESLAGRTVVHVTHRPEEAAGTDLVIEMA